MCNMPFFQECLMLLSKAVYGVIVLLICEVLQCVVLMMLFGVSGATVVN